MKRSSNGDDLIAAAVQVIEKRFARKHYTIESPGDAAEYLQLRLAGLDREEFMVLFLDARNRVIAAETMFRGTIAGCIIYPREIARSALRRNASAVLLAHNHPSGHPEPSNADIVLTNRIVTALEILDIRVLDHLVVGGAQHVSLAERGMLYRADDGAAVARKSSKKKRRKAA